MPLGVILFYLQARVSLSEQTERTVNVMQKRKEIPSKNVKF